MYYSLLTAAGVLLVVLLLLVRRYIARSERAQEAPAGFTVVPLTEGTDPRQAERFVRACCWENAFGGGMARRVLLVSCGCKELDGLAERLVREFGDMGVCIVGADKLAGTVLGIKT